MTWIIAGPVYPYRGGIAHFTTALVQAARAHHKVHALSFSRLYPGFLFPGDSTLDPSAAPQEIHPWGLVHSLNPLNWWIVLNRMRKLRPELVVFQWWTTFLAPCYGTLAYWLRRWEIPVVFIIHNVLPHEPRRMDRWLARSVLRSASGYLVMAAREQQRLESLMPEARDRTILHQHPVYVHIPRAALSKEAARQKLELPQELPILLSFGFVRRYKGILHLLQSIARLRDEGRPVYLLVAGEIWYDLDQYIREINNLGIMEYVRFDNRYIPDEEVPIYFRAADIFVAPYLEGTQSGSVRLAVNQGIPMVISEHLAEGLETMPEGAVQTFRAGDVQALCESITAQLGVAQLHQREANAQSPGVTWDDLVLALTDFHERILQNP